MTDEEQKFMELRDAARAQWLSLDRILGMMIGVSIPEEVEEAGLVCPSCGAGEDKLEDTSELKNPKRLTCLECGRSCRMTEEKDNGSS